MNHRKHLVLESHSILLFFTLFILYAVVYMTKNMFSSALAVIVEQGVMTKSETGFITATYWLVYGFFQIVGGFVTDKYDPHKLVVIGVIGAIISNIIIYLNQNYYVMLASWSFNAVIQFGVWPGIFKIISTQTDKNVRGPAVLWISLSSSCGLGLSMLIASFVKQWQNNFLVSTIVLAASLLGYMIIYHRLEREMVDDMGPAPKEREKPEKKAPMLPLMFASGLVVILTAGFFRFSVENGIKLMTPVMLMESYDSLPAAISTRMSIILVAFSVAGLFLTNFLRKKIENEMKALVLLGTCAVLPLVVACFVGKIHYIWILAALSLAVVLLCGGSAFSMSYISIKFEKYGRIGTVMGILNATASFGNILASWGYAALAERFPWQMITLLWLGLDIGLVLLALSVISRWKKFSEK